MKTHLAKIALTVLRVWLGYQWLTSGLSKATNPAWMNTGMAVRGYWTRAAGLLPDSQPLIRYGWYQSFIESLVRGDHHTWFAPFVVIGEIAAGAALILGAGTVFAAFMGGFMNLNFMLAGTTSSNPVMYTISIILITAGTGLAGYYGLDRFIVPKVEVLGKRFRYRQPALGEPEAHSLTS